MQCGVCKRKYESNSNNQSCIPRVLVRCGHTFCEQCIRLVMNQNNIICWECKTSSQCKQSQDLPINYTLLSLIVKQQLYRCKIHGQKLEAYCQKDNQFLCITCLISAEHKSHKFTSLVQKVQKDKKILQQCFIKIQQAKTITYNNLEKIKNIQRQLQQKNINYRKNIQKFYMQFKIQLQKQENKIIFQSSEIFQQYIKDLNYQTNDIKQKQRFIEELQNLYKQVMCLPDLQYLYENNKRIFIMQNCKINQKIKKINIAQFDQVLLISQIQKWLNQQFNSSIGKNNSKQGGELVMGKKNKQPAILAVNLNEQYHRHYIKVQKKNQNRTIRIPIDLSHSSRKNKQTNNSHLQVDSSFNRDLENQLPSGQISSFMHSSRALTSLKDEASFTIYPTDQRVYHFGGCKGQAQYYKIEHKQKILLPKSSLVIKQRSQCVHFKKYNQNKILILGGKYNQENEKNCILQYDIYNQKIQKSILQIDQYRHHFGTVINNNKLYTFGGKLQCQTTNAFEQYSLGNIGLTLKKLSSMLEHRDQFGYCLGLDGKLYVCGGINTSNQILSRCQKYNWEQNCWQEMPKMKQPRKKLTLIALPNAIYAIGGQSSPKKISCSVEMFNYNGKKWITVPSMLECRSMCTAITTADFKYIIVFGGMNTVPLKSIEVYDILHNQWIITSEMHYARSQHCSINISI